MKHLITLVLSLFAITASAQNLVANPSFDESTPILDYTGAVVYTVPNDWTCTNYPRVSRSCAYSPGYVTIYSHQPGTTLASRAAKPANPTWWQTVVMPATGTYTLTATIVKAGMPAYETYGQSVVFSSGLTKLAVIPHTSMTPGQPLTVSVPVQLNAGPQTISFGRLLAGPYYGGFQYQLHDLAIQ